MGTWEGICQQLELSSTGHMFTGEPTMPRSNVKGMYVCEGDQPRRQRDGCQNSNTEHQASTPIKDMSLSSLLTSLPIVLKEGAGYALPVERRHPSGEAIQWKAGPAPATPALNFCALE